MADATRTPSEARGADDSGADGSGADEPATDGPTETWLFVGEVEISWMGLAEDVCRISLLRGPDKDVLRLRHRQLHDLDSDVSCPATAGSDLHAAIEAITHAARTTDFDARRPLAAGLLTCDECQEAIDAGDSLWKADRSAVREASLAAERANPSRLLLTARNVGLRPEPTSFGIGQWQAGCPGRNHSLMLSPGTETFGCGYCKAKGGPGELEVFIATRRAASATGCGNASCPGSCDHGTTGVRGSAS